MKLEPDCIRAILLSIEDTCEFQKHWKYSGSSSDPFLASYPYEQTLYHIRYCANAKLIYNIRFSDNGAFVIVGDLTPLGHEFLCNIREDKIWNGVKSIAMKVGSTSLNALIQIASNVITELIKAQFGLAAPIS